MSVFDTAKWEIRELLDLVVEIDRVSGAFAEGRFFYSTPAKEEFESKQRRAIELREKYT